MNLASILLAAEDLQDGIGPDIRVNKEIRNAYGHSEDTLKAVSKKRCANDRELAHIKSEQKRRDNISDGFALLRQSIPFCAGVVDSKSSTLRKGR